MHLHVPYSSKQPLSLVNSLPAFRRAHPSPIYQKIPTHEYPFLPQLSFFSQTLKQFKQPKSKVKNQFPRQVRGQQSQWCQLVGYVNKFMTSSDITFVPAESYLFALNLGLLLTLSMKFSLLLLALLLASCVVASGRMLQAQEPQGKMRILPVKGQRNDDNIYKFVDHALQEKYWYYLTKACLLYLSAVERPDGSYQFLAIYRNLVGTFLAITTWTKGETEFEVNTLVRLGNGLALKQGANYKPVAVKPLKVRYTLDDHDVLIDFTDCDDIKINGKSIHYYYDCPDCKDKPDILLVKDCKKFSEYVREKYWFYLRDAKVVYSSIGKTDKKNYCLVTYVNLVGTFFAVGTHCEDETPSTKVNNFVRLGNGFEKDSEAEYDPFKFDKVHLRLKNFVE